MKPNNVHYISIQGAEKSAAQNLLDLQRKSMLLHLRDYQRAGQPVPEAVLQRARELGVMGTKEIN
jgi:hypothetical protein